jgi:hypothetical protein
VGARTRHALALAAGLTLVGCGERGPSEEEQVRRVVAAFGTAAGARDYALLCDRLLAPALVRTVQRAGLTCEAALGKALGEVREIRLAIGRVTVTGDRARAEIRSSARGEEPSRDVVELVKADGRWRIASLD